MFVFDWALGVSPGGLREPFWSDFGASGGAFWSHFGAIVGPFRPHSRGYALLLFGCSWLRLPACSGRKARREAAGQHAKPTGSRPLAAEVAAKRPRGLDDCPGTPSPSFCCVGRPSFLLAALFALLLLVLLAAFLVFSSACNVCGSRCSRASRSTIARFIFGGKIAPRAPQERPRGAKSGPRGARRGQESAKRGPRATKRRQEASGSDFGAILERSGIPWDPQNPLKSKEKQCF